MTKQEFKTLRVGDTVEYNSRGILVGCQFKITKLLNNVVEGEVTKKGTSGSTMDSYSVGKLISGTCDNLTLVNPELVAVEPFATLALSVQEAAVLFRLLRSVGGDEQASIRKFVSSISTKLYREFPKEECLDRVKMFEFDKIIYTDFSLEALDSKLVEIGLMKPKAAARHKLKGPDGKWAPRNYRRVLYPEHGTGTPIERHILMGDFVEGKGAATNVHVEEWCAASKSWKPKTYALAKIKPVTE